jgi:hypothetical protein
MKKIWKTKRIKFKFLFINFHLYREPESFRFYIEEFQQGLKAKNVDDISTKYVGMTWHKWYKRINTVCPLQYKLRTFISTIKDIPTRIRRRYRKIKHDVFNPSNVLKINTLNRSYSDEREQMLHAVFQLVVNYVESNPELLINYNSDETTKAWWKECKTIYRWWKKFNKFEKKFEKRHHLNYNVNYKKNPTVYMEECIKIDTEYENEIEEMLIRAIKIRKGLWI